MKKLVVSVIIAALALSSVACGTKVEMCAKEGCKLEAYKEGLCPDHYIESKTSDNTKDEEKSKETKEETKKSDSKKDDKKDKVKEIAIGETIATENFEAVLNKVELSYDVVPENPPSYYSHYPADSGQVYVHVDMDIKNLQKQEVRCDEIYTVTVDYNNGFTYKSFAITEDTDGDFTYANITSVTPLQTLGVHALIDCPQEVETSTNPLFITITFADGSSYKYTIR